MNKKLVILYVASALVLSLCSLTHAAPPQNPANVSGTWAAAIQEPGGLVPNTLTIKQQGRRIKGTLKSSTHYWRFTGTVMANQIRFSIARPAAFGATVVEEFTGVVAGDTMRGTVITSVSPPSQLARRERQVPRAWSAKRVK